MVENGLYISYYFHPEQFTCIIETFHFFSSVSIFYFEQVNVSWELIFLNIFNNLGNCLHLANSL